MIIYDMLKRMKDAGDVTVEAECIAKKVLEAVNLKTSIVTFSLGSSNAGDVIMSFMAEICGAESEEAKPPNTPTPLAILVDCKSRSARNICRL